MERSVELKFRAGASSKSKVVDRSFATLDHGKGLQLGIGELHQSLSRSVESKIRRVTKISISEEIAKQIMDLISNGDLTPGQRLPSERDLCENFGASRSSLREALRCLSIVGVLNARVGEGTSVAPDGGKFLRKILEWRMITEKHDIENLLEIRIALEGVSAANAALYATPEDIENARTLLTKMKASVKDETQFAILDLDFHLTLANASRNTLLLDLISVIRSQLARALSTVLQLPNARPLSLKEHSAIFEAIERRDADAARKAMHDHLEAALKRYAEATAAGNGSRTKTATPANAKRTRARTAKK
jgi:GntR family transcriptional regulator, transcriptional repressor for pyruvate dehydrogenase complex